jgi:small subunit ribosomal protein S21
LIKEKDKISSLNLKTVLFGGDILVKVIVKNNEPIDKALRRFKRSCNNAGLIRDMRRLTQFEKPTTCRRKQKRERAKALRRLQITRNSI